MISYKHRLSCVNKCSHFVPECKERGGGCKAGKIQGTDSLGASTEHLRWIFTEEVRWNTGNECIRHKSQRIHSVGAESTEHIRWLFNEIAVCAHVYGRYYDSRRIYDALARRVSIVWVLVPRAAQTTGDSEGGRERGRGRGRRCGQWLWSLVKRDSHLHTHCTCQ